MNCAVGRKFKDSCFINDEINKIIHALNPDILNTMKGKTRKKKLQYWEIKVYLVEIFQELLNH